MNNLQKEQMVYYTRVIPACDMYELLDLKLRTIAEDYFVGIDERSKQAFLFNSDDINKIVFLSRPEALEFVKNEELKYRNDD